MLVLSRERGQSVRIGDTVVTVLKVNGRVRLGIEAPQEVRIVRTELDGDAPAEASPAPEPASPLPALRVA